jgi:uncharacterized protein YcfL
MKKYIITVLTVMFFSCKSDQKTELTSKEVVKETVFDDSKYVLDDSFKMGDARRYGVTAETAKQGHPAFGKNRMAVVLDLAEESGMEVSFPSGYYGMDLTLDSRKNLTLNFDNSEFNLIHITQRKKEDSIPENIVLKGKLIAYDRLGITEAKNISIDTIILKSDLKKNLRKIRNRGCHIYHGCDNINIGYIEIKDVGSGSKKHLYTHAAIAIDGWNNNPSNITINKAHIKSTDRHGVYITGTDNYIKELTIDKFGIGTSKFMDGMQDADNKKGEHKEFTALWINKCYDCAFDKVTINEKDSKGKYTAFFDAGNKLKATIIDELVVLNDNPSITIKRDPNTAVEATVSIKE